MGGRRRRFLSRLRPASQRHRFLSRATVTSSDAFWSASAHPVARLVPHTSWGHRKGLRQCTSLELWRGAVETDDDRPSVAVTKWLRRLPTLRGTVRHVLGEKK